MSLTQEQINTLRKQLRNRHATLRAEISKELVRSDGEQYADLAGRVHDPGDESLADLLVDLSVARIDQQVREVSRIENALTNIATGTYGYCEECGGEIGFERLKAQPTATRCIDCQTRHEQNYAQERRPSTM